MTNNNRVWVYESPEMMKYKSIGAKDVESIEDFRKLMALYDEYLLCCFGISDGVIKGTARIVVNQYEFLSMVFTLDEIYLNDVINAFDLNNQLSD